MIRATLPASINIEQRLESQSYVRCDPTQIHQICINLCTNAGHAMEEEGGVLEVHLRDISLDDSFASGRSGMSPGPHLQLSLVDSGKGIAESVLSRIFDPFFTTKDFDLVITDLTMPQLAGKALAEKIHEIRPDIPIILSSGFSTAISNDAARSMGFSVYLKKPLVMGKLAAVLRDVLDGGKAPYNHR